MDGTLEGLKQGRSSEDTGTSSPDSGSAQQEVPKFDAAQFNRPEGERWISLTTAPASASDIISDNSMEHFPYLMKQGGFHPEDTLTAVLNREIGRRQLAFRSLDRVMHRAGFTDFDVNHAFFLTSINAEQVVLSEPILASAARVKGLQKCLGNEVPKESSSNKDPYTYYQSDLFGYEFSFGFIGLTSSVDGVRQFSVLYPIIGLDDRVLESMKALEGKDADTALAVGNVLKFIWTTSTLGGHDHIHALIGDLMTPFDDAPFIKDALSERLAALRDTFPGGYTNETQAIVAHGLALAMIRAQSPDVPVALQRQASRFFESCNVLQRAGLEPEACAQLLTIGMNQYQSLLPPDFITNYTDGVLNMILETNPYLEKQQYKGKTLEAGIRSILKGEMLAMARFDIHGIPVASSELPTREQLNFSHGQALSYGHFREYLRILDQCYQVHKEYAEGPGQQNNASKYAEQRTFRGKRSEKLEKKVA